MSLKAFEFAKVEEGHLYELARGYIVVSEVANFPHAWLIAFIRTRLVDFHLENPQSLYVILAASECKLPSPLGKANAIPILPSI